MITNQIAELTQYLQALSKKQLRQHITIAIAGVAVLAFSISYYIYYESSTLVAQLKKLNTTTNKIALITAQNEALQQEEIKIKAILNANPNFNMSTYFERFYTKHAIKPEPNWKPEEGAIIESTQEGIKYQEILLQATFKNQTMQKLVTLLQDIYQEPIIYLKALEVSSSPNRTISFELTLATKQYKREVVEE
ncbi:hypothetical protein KKA53_02535 [Candidatus Dependentiae bacterium]|nr:hypothetical protein [Candidatus Dependentiae bacterium]